MPVCFSCIPPTALWHTEGSLRMMFLASLQAFKCKHQHTGHRMKLFYSLPPALKHWIFQKHSCKSISPMLDYRTQQPPPVIPLSASCYHPARSLLKRQMIVQKLANLPTLSLLRLINQPWSECTLRQVVAQKQSDQIWDGTDHDKPVIWP